MCFFDPLCLGFIIAEQKNRLHREKLIIFITLQGFIEAVKFLWRSLYQLLLTQIGFLENYLYIKWQIDPLPSVFVSFIVYFIPFLHHCNAQLRNFGRFLQTFSTLTSIFYFKDLQTTRAVKEHQLQINVVGNH